jgi:hypothetical protein
MLIQLECFLLHPSALIPSLDSLLFESALSRW